MTSATDLAEPLPARLTRERFGDAFLFLTVACSSIVMFEPAPYDLFLALHAVIAFALGLRMPRTMAPLVILMLLYDVGGILSLTQVTYWEPENPYIFVAISALMVVDAVFLAATTADRPHRIAVVLQATVAAAVLAAVLGILGWVAKIDALTLYGRAKGTFKDPNVYGPFLVLPLIWLVHRMLTHSFVRAWSKAVPAGLILIALLLSFSRAAWGMAAGALVLIYLVVFIAERDTRRRLRLIGIAVGAVLGLALLFALALSFEEVRTMFFERAKLTQSYDSARLGRFARHWIGFLWATELPLGIGPYQFGHHFPEDPHNVYLKSLMTYGWLGFLAYVTLALWTLGKLFPLMFKPRPWQAAAQCVWVVLFVHQVASWIIDSDHWRHFFLLWGLAWGMIALEAGWQRRMRGAGAEAGPRAPEFAQARRI